MLNYSLPLIPGWDLSGVVEATGPGVAGLKKGDEVYTRPDISRDGAYAEYIVVRESEVALKPKSLDHIKAAAPRDCRHLAGGHPARHSLPVPEWKDLVPLLVPKTMRSHGDTVP